MLLIGLSVSVALGRGALGRGALDRGAVVGQAGDEAVGFGTFAQVAEFFDGTVVAA